MSPVRREERILNLLSAVLAARAPLSFAEVRDRVAGYDDEASESALQKRFDRDKVTLKKLGVPLTWIPEDEHGRSGYRVERERFFLDEIRFTVEEGIVLAALQRALGEGRAVEDGLSSALAKIGVDSPLADALRESVGEQQLLDPRIPEEEADRLTALAEAVATVRPVTFRYYSLNSGEVAERRVEPWGVGYHRGHWYLVGRDRKVREERVFRTSRMRGPVRLGRPGQYRIPKDFSLRDRIERRAWELRRGETVTVKVRFAPELAWMVAENLRPGQSFAHEPDGSGVLTLAASDPGKVVAWVAHHGPAAEILSPPRLRRETREWLAAIRRRYSR